MIYDILKTEEKADSLTELGKALNNTIESVIMIIAGGGGGTVH